jgi:methionyl-tRNA formyltransferase
VENHPSPAATPLRIVFMGTPALAAHILERLAAASGARFQVIGVVTRADQRRGRGLRLEPSGVGATAARLGIPVLKPAKILTREFLDQLHAMRPDLLVVAAYRRILPKSVLDAPRLMPLNVHASLLPRHRGAAPTEAAILDGDAVTGVTIMRVTEEMDAGPILLQREIAIASDETQATLKDKLAELGADTLIEAIEMLIRGELREIPQDDRRATYTKPVKKEDAVIDWSGDAARIERMTRAYDPWPTARTKFRGEDLMVWRARVAADAAGSELPGTMIELAPVPIVRCGIGALELLEVQAPGRKRMAAADFMRGKRVAVGECLGG